MDYKEKLELAKDWYNDQSTTKKEKVLLEKLFPEIIESEDERIRKDIISYLQHESQVKRFVGDIEYNKWVAWLEKQGGQKSVTIQQNDIAPKIEPKFKIGDWITNDIDFTFKVMSIKDNMYYRDDGYFIDVETADKTFRLWTIADAKGGDVLQLGNITAMFKRYIGEERCICYCSVYNREFEIRADNVYGCYNAVPATKEQRDLLFSKMHEAGYELDAEKKELRKIDGYCEEHCKGFQETCKCFADGECKAKRDAEQKPIWSEEDEDMFKSIIATCELAEQDRDSIPARHLLEMQINWLKSLKDRVQPKQEWSEEDEKIIDDLTQTISQYTVFAHREPKEIIHWLKSLKPQPHWKPTEEQLQTLKDTINQDAAYKRVDVLESLINDLKKL